MAIWHVDCKDCPLTRMRSALPLFLAFGCGYKFADSSLSRQGEPKMKSNLPGLYRILLMLSVVLSLVVGCTDKPQNPPQTSLSDTSGESAEATTPTKITIAPAFKPIPIYCRCRRTDCPAPDVGAGKCRSCPDGIYPQDAGDAEWGSGVYLVWR